MDMSRPFNSKIQRRVTTSVPPGSRGNTRYLQDRLALFARIGLGLVAFLLIASNLVWLFLVRGETNPLICFERTSNLPDLIHVFALVIVWLLCRRAVDLGQRFLVGLDFGLMAAIAIGIALSVMMVDQERPASPVFGLLAVSIALTARAVVVPSSPRFTAMVCVVSMIPLAAVFYLDRVELDLVMRDAGRTMNLSVMGIWSVLVGSTATIASQVIYGLRRKVTQARQLGQYQLEARLGAGGMGEVYRARHAMLRRPTAIKLMRLEIAGCEGAQRFEREVQATSGLTHPNTIAIYDYGQTPDGIFYYAMELLDGVDLEHLVARMGPLDPARVIYLLAQVCGSLAEAHAQDLIHRDIKPANIFVCRRGGRHDVVKVLDFGLVKNLDEDDGMTMAAGIQVMGTPRYMAPESVSDVENISHRADIYSLGCVAYFLLTGTPPFDGAGAIEVLGKHLHTKPQRLSERAGRPFPADIEDLVMRCLAKNPADRPASVDEVEEALLGCRDADGWSERDARLWWQKFGADLGIPEAAHFLAAEPQPLAGEGTLRLDIGREMADPEWYEEFDVSRLG